MERSYLISLLERVTKQFSETELVEFKENFHSAKEIGELISAISNSACILNKTEGYIIFGIKDSSHELVGTTFKAKSYKKGNENLEHWLNQRLNPRINFQVDELDYKGKHFSFYIIPATKNIPVKFENVSYIRINSITRKLIDFPEKEVRIWKKEHKQFETEIAKKNLINTDVISLLSTQTYFDLMKIHYPTTIHAVLEKFEEEKFVFLNKSGRYDITNLGALLFAKDLINFETLYRKSVRVIIYKGRNKIDTEREQIGRKGYALGFEGLIDWINSQLPTNEEIGKALRNEKRMYPEIAIRELVANALIHQDFSQQGFPMIEIYSDRIEITNAGIPLIESNRFIDKYISRNHILADIMRRMGFCEEKGSGIDKVIFYNELYQLPAINVLTDDIRTKVIMYCYKTLKEMDKKDSLRACYQHACLKYVSNDKMTNTTLRERFGIETKNASTASRIIKDAIEEGLIKDEDENNTSRKYRNYIPFWV